MNPWGLQETDCWLHQTVAPRASDIEGTGLFAKAEIAPGTVVAQLGGRLVSVEELHELLARAVAAYVDTIAVTETQHLVLPPRRDVGYGNHSCDPNLWWGGAYTLVARRVIRAGAEVTNDYATSTGNPDFVMECRCRSTLCRSTITGNDWQRPDLRQRYGNHWTPALLDRIASAQGRLC